MKLLFVTQVLDRRDAVLGFVTRWVEGLSREVEGLRVLALEVGDVSGLPDNVDVREIGRKGTLRRYLRYRRYLSEAFGEGFDGLLTHMVPRYSTLAAGAARRARAKHFLWYTHKGVDQRLLSALKVVDGAFTASELSLRVDTPKKIVTGHGIDLGHFDVGPAESGLQGDGLDDAKRPARLLSVGRLTPAKDPLTTVEALALLREWGHRVTLRWAGAGLARGDDAYADGVKARIRDLGLVEDVHLAGAVPYPEVPAAFRSADLFINASGTGSVDKVVLEAMSARRPFVSCNESIPPVLQAASRLDAPVSAFQFKAGSATSLAESLEGWLTRTLDDRRAVGDQLRRIVAEHHEVDALMARLVRRIGEA